MATDERAAADGREPTDAMYNEGDRAAAAALKAAKQLFDDTCLQSQVFKMAELTYAPMQQKGRTQGADYGH